jgi:hypothetical protein
VLVDVIAQPMLWLAVAALVFGSRVLSLAELWRTGQPYAARIPGMTVFARYGEKRAFRRLGSPPKGVRLAAARIQEAFFGDIDDKYLPTLHALRLVVRAGPIFLGAYIFVYSLVIILQNYLERSIHWLVGGHESQFWVRWEPLSALIQDALIEPVRLCLLAVAFRRCLELFAQRSAASAPIEIEARPETHLPAMASAGSGLGSEPGS